MEVNSDRRSEGIDAFLLVDYMFQQKNIHLT